MTLKKRIPSDFYKLFRTKNMDVYMQVLVELYQKNSELCTALGLTFEESTACVAEVTEHAQIAWTEDEEVNEDTDIVWNTPSAILRRLIEWGWLRSDYDERLNTNIISFPEYSRLYVELFEALQREEDDSERESILSIYSALFTYHSDADKNNEILKSALRTSKNLEQLLSNMQNGMRSYFEELSQSKNFIEIQQVLVDEINNNDSKRYAILTTTDSFYRYKEAVKDLISHILNENEKRLAELNRQFLQKQENELKSKRLQQQYAYYEAATELVNQIERQFDIIERRYNKLIEQKAIFARRALARLRYILQEGTHDGDSLLKLLRLLDEGTAGEEILEKLGEKSRLTIPYRVFDNDSMYKRRENSRTEYRPLKQNQQEKEATDITDFVPKPLYTGRELRAFREKNTKDGVFTTTRETVSSIEDLEKIMLLWQEMTQNASDEREISLDGEIQNEAGFTFSKLTIRENT